MDEEMDPWDVAQFCYLTTRGRRTGRPHTVEIWFGMKGDKLYMLSGGGEGSDWVRNIRSEPAVVVDLRRPGIEPRVGRARAVNDPREDLRARRLLAAKYQGWRKGGPLSSWARTALPVAVDFDWRSLNRVTSVSMLPAVSLWLILLARPVGLANVGV